MRLLLDTHVLLALTAERAETLSRPVQEAISASDSLLYVSVASLWETAIKYRLGKLALATPPKSLPDIFRRMDIALLIIDQHHVLAELDPEPTTRDPFDRLLLAQCLVEDLRLVTLDRALVGHPLAWRDS